MSASTFTNFTSEDEIFGYWQELVSDKIISANDAKNAYFTYTQGVAQGHGSAAVLEQVTRWLEKGQFNKLMVAKGLR